MKTELFSDIVNGTSIVFDGTDTVTITVATVPFSKLTIDLDLDDVDRLLALREHAVDPDLDLADFFKDVYSCPSRPATRAAEAFIACAGSLAETIR